jgi:hypothetical protein
MATTHLKDLVAVVGTYKDRDGNDKKQYRNIGKLLRNENGDFLVMDRTFSPAGMPGSDSQVFLSLFDPKPRDGQRNNQSPQPQGGDIDDEVPF